jgi:hypothetical protein
MVVAKYLLSGEKLYGGIFSHHQPLMYVLSMIVQKITDPNSIYLLIKRHRELVAVWSILWSLFLIKKFKLTAAGFVIIYEILKFVLLGNLFLAESLAVYPVIYLTFLVLKREKLKEIQQFFAAVCFSFTTLLLSSVWPLLVVLAVFIYINNKSILKLKYLLPGIILPFIFVLPFISISGYFNDTVWVNYKYYIPYSGNMSLIDSFLSPFLLFFTKTSRGLAEFIQALVVVLAVYFVINFKKNKGLFLFIFISLGLANMHYTQPGLAYFRGFHSLIWVALLILFAVFSLSAVSEISRKYAILSFVLFAGVIYFLIQTSVLEGLFIQRDVGNDFYINYSRQFDSGEAVRIMKNKKDSLFVVPDEMLIHWQAGDVKHFSRFTFFYDWMEKTDDFKDEVHTLFQQSPPTFFYCDCKDMDIYELTQGYSRMKKHGEYTNLFVLPQKLEEITNKQKQDLIFLGYEI